MFSFFRINIFALIFFTVLSINHSSWVFAFNNSPTPQELVNLLKHRFERLKNYHCQFISTKNKNGKTVIDTNDYYFKKPKLIRLEVTSGKDKGAKVVLNKNNKVRAKAGGVLGLFTITMEPRDKRLQDTDGSGFVDTDLGTTIKDIEKALVGATATVTILERGKKTYRLQLERAENKSDLIIIDVDLLLPIEWYTFRNKRFDSKTEWKNLIVDTELKDSLFDL